MAAPAPIRRRVKAPRPQFGADQVTYAAAFIDPAVIAVDPTDDGWEFTLAREVDPARLSRGLEALIARFAQPPPPAPEPDFRLDPPDGAGDAGALARLAEARVIDEIHPGLVVFREPASTLLRFLDDAVLARFARPFAAAEESVPACIPVAALARTDHLASFPEHLHFLSHLTQDLDVLDRFAARARDAAAGPPAPAAGDLGGVELVQNPSVCYHCYAARRGEEVAENTALTAAARCHRFEAANHREPGRLLEFTLREVIFLGDGVYLRQTRERTLALMESLARDWSLYGALEVANDPFFTADYAVKAAHQRRMAMKVEYRAFLPGEPRGLAVMSSNLHGPAFAKGFGLTRRGRPVQTGCLGFGLERLALVLLAQHGAEPSRWPNGLGRDFAAWRAREPLA